MPTKLKHKAIPRQKAVRRLILVCAKCGGCISGGPEGCTSCWLRDEAAKRRAASQPKPHVTRA